MLPNKLKLNFAVNNNFKFFLHYRKNFYNTDASQSGGSGGDKKERDDKCDNFSPVKKENENKVKICEVCRAYPCECNPSAPTTYDVRF